MPVLIRVAYDAFRDVEKRMKWKFWDKERERSNRASAMADRGSIHPVCPLHHQTIAWSGPPHDTIRRYICLQCSAYASEDMIKDMGYEFLTCPDYVMYDLMDEVLKQRGQVISYAGVGGNGR